MDIRTILIIGAGTMGRQIAMSCALGGYTTILQDISGSALDAARSDLESWAAGRVAKGKLQAEFADAALARLSQSTELDASAAQADLVIEAAVERLDIKRSIFAELGKNAPAHAILVTNSSTLASSQVAEASGRASQVCNMHFFNPALVMKCVEIVRNEQTSDETIQAVTAVARALGKEPVLVNKEIPGFIANRMMGAIQREALNLASAEVASIKDIDTTARTALGHPMGPFELMDLVGLDVIDFIAQATYAETGEEVDQPHPLITQKVTEGKLGRKSGEGFYEYRR
ncbi:3-hydroxyacyl-CoA dehydrogenase [Arthrobacter sp. MYb211]|uniref:3-hydroxyacyl-CoA dehydrogenase family protein n=1 Tax=Micrococcaceae TaxID=1268 RepID=UPI000BB9B5F2|nr:MULTISPECIES: 3-hydroxyacyl-CoA dehydrogenase family protein [Micrococcaceae]PCC27186.1 3-hydroxyacyl-CoA dehydrogenase [Glutamicibacter sp. BW80]PQZ97357.1 3-hydroxyacyl-CoA dehydrogenase [Arthrobacter sp. MYb224]PRA10802.1 3-hydroxyacyl-CoA dehydrogenase [Arthrobacter sp. MYb221]PRC06861.1 3-hydroxyacyl-CoA dehydrogenase [Arthrobacter sp. MYb211]